MKRPVAWPSNPRIAIRWVGIGLLATCIAIPAHAQLRGSNSPHQNAYFARNDAGYSGRYEKVHHAVPQDYSESLLHGFGSGTKFVLRESLSSLIFAGSHAPDLRRDSVVAIPNRASLRYSMMPAANLFVGLRGSEASTADSISAALRGSYALRARLERTKIDRARVYGAVANFLPKVEATTELNDEPNTSVLSNSIKRQRALGVDVQLSVPVFTSGVNINTYRQAVHISRASDFNYLAEEQRVAMETIESHINLRLNRKIESTLTDNVESMRKIMRIAQRLYEAGDASRTDIAIARANVENANSELNAARKIREETLTDYETTTGLDAPQYLQLPEPASLVPASVDEAFAIARRNNPTIAAAEHTAIASDHAAKAERGRYGPQVSLFGGYQRDLQSSVDAKLEESWNVGVRLKVSLLDFNSVPNINAARHEALESHYKAQDQVVTVERLIRKQWIAFQSARSRTGIIDRQLKAVLESVTGTRREYEAGFRSITDVLNDQVRLAGARIALDRARHEQMLAAYELALTTSHPSLRTLALTEGR